MKKLKSKIFWTIFIILSLFLVTIIFIFNYQDYNSSKKLIEQNLFRMNNDRSKNIVKNHGDIPLKPGFDNDVSLMNEEEPKRFMDATIYTIILNNSNEIVNIISHTEDGTISNDIKSVASRIITENKNSVIHIGNLYFSSYSYNYNANNYIILIDNTKVSRSLLSSLRTSSLLFVLLEIIIIIVSLILSKWIIKPVEMSFNKQKQFIGDASHELKTPLSVIMASAESLKVSKKDQK